MSRLDDGIGAVGQVPAGVIGLRLRSGIDAPSVARVRSLTGEDERAIEEKGDAIGRAGDVDLETAILERAVEDIGDEPADAAMIESQSVGDRNRLLLAALHATYGAPSTLLTTCPECGTRVELPFDVSMFIDALAATGPLQTGAIVDGRDVHIRFRLPTGADLLALRGAEGDPDTVLFGRCLVSVDGVEVGQRHSGTIRAAVESAIERIDPCADIVVKAACPECDASVLGRIAPGQLIWTEMNRYGGIFSELHQLARAYHWSEADILALTPTRRRRYLALVVAEDSASRSARSVS